MRKMQNLEEVLVFLHDIQGAKRDDLKIEIKLEEETFLPIIFHKDYQAQVDFDIFSLFLEEQDIERNKDQLKEGRKIILAITEFFWQTSGGELKTFSGPKQFIEGISLDVRKNFIKVKITKILSL